MKKDKEEVPRGPGRLVAKVKRVLTEKGIRQNAMAAHLRVTEERVSKWLSGTGEPSLRQGVRIAKFLGVPVEWLSDDEQDWPPPEPAGDSGAPITKGQRRVLDIADALGHDLAIDRMLMRVDITPVRPGPENGTEKPANPSKSRGA